MRFVLVDRIVALQPGVSVDAEAALSAREEIFEDHFPGFPVVPGVLLTEMMGQAAAKCLLADGRGRGNPMLAEIRHARFREWVRPDQVVRLHAEVVRDEEKYVLVRCEGSVEGRKVCSAELMLVFLPAGELPADYRDQVLESYLARVGRVRGGEVS